MYNLGTMAGSCDGMAVGGDDRRFGELIHMVSQSLRPKSRLSFLMVSADLPKQRHYI